VAKKHQVADVFSAARKPLVGWKAQTVCVPAFCNASSVPTRGFREKPGETGHASLKQQRITHPQAPP
jgi:hypothetical protein